MESRGKIARIVDSRVERAEAPVELRVIQGRPKKQPDKRFTIGPVETLGKKLLPLETPCRFGVARPFDIALMVRGDLAFEDVDGTVGGNVDIEALSGAVEDVHVVRHVGSSAVQAESQSHHRRPFGRRTPAIKRGRVH